MGAKSIQSCLTLCDPMDCSLRGSSIHGILQVIILEWVAMPSSRGSSWLRDQIGITYISCRWVFLITSATWEGHRYLWGGIIQTTIPCHSFTFGLLFLIFKVDLLYLKCDCWEKEIANHSSLLAWKIPWTEEPGGLQTMGSQRFGYDWVTNTRCDYGYSWVYITSLLCAWYLSHLFFVLIFFFCP